VHEVDLHVALVRPVRVEHVPVVHHDLAVDRVDDLEVVASCLPFISGGGKRDEFGMLMVLGTADSDASSERRELIPLNAAACLPVVKMDGWPCQWNAFTVCPPRATAEAERSV
jgi:hypothetical protein